MNLRKWWKRAWESPTIMTWASLGTTMSKFVLVLPLILYFFPAEEVAVWYLMATFIAFQTYLNFGFGATASRYFAYAMGGATDLDRPHEGSGSPNHALLGRVYRTVQSLLIPLGLLAGVIVLLMGTPMLWKPIQATVDPSAMWVAWGITLAGSTVHFVGLPYSIYLQGTNRVALLRRWEAITNTLAIATTVAVILSGGGLVALAIATQAWAVIGVLRNRWMAVRTEAETFAVSVTREERRETLRSLWGPSWRSGLGIILNVGVVRLSAGLLAQFVDPATLAAYLVAFNLLDRLNQFSMAPFYSRLPRLASLYAQGHWDRLLASSRRGMALTAATFVFGSISVGIAADRLLGFIGSDTPFIGLWFWTFMAFGLLLHRYGAMNLQLYTLSNRVVWHIADGVSGGLFLASWLLLFPVIGIYAVPAGLAIAYGGFYTPYSLRLWTTMRRARRDVPASLKEASLDSP